MLSKLSLVCDNITTEDTKLENKIVLSIGIRHEAEKYMFQQIGNYTGQLRWTKNKQDNVGGVRNLLNLFMKVIIRQGNYSMDLDNLVMMKR